MPDTPSTPPTPPSPPPALVRPRKSDRDPRSLAAILPWLVPLAAAALVLALVVQSAASRGPRITLRFSDGYGLRENDPVMHRGVQIGRVRATGVDLPSRKAVVTIDLDKSAADLHRSGRFWIVRPELSLSRVSGLETIVGPRYIAADLDTTGAATRPVALDTPPSDTSGDGLRLVIRAHRAGSLAAGSPVSYREMRIGEITRVGLAADGRSVEIGIQIEPAHARLVRASSVFWNVSGIGLDLGIVGGLKLKAESLRTILVGGIALATPERPWPAEPVTSGHEFTLSEFEEEFTRWAPDLTGTKP